MPKIPAVKRSNRQSSRFEVVAPITAANSSISAQHDLEQAVPYLLARAGVRMGQAFTRELKQFNLTLAEWRILAALLHKAQQRLAELAEHTSTEPSTLSRTVNSLVACGLLARERSNADARALALSLTTEGQELALRIVPLAQLYERVAVVGIPAIQLELLKDALRRIYVNMDNLDRGR